MTSPGYTVVEAYTGLRTMILSSKARAAAENPLHIHGMLMETGHDKAVVTLVAMDDDTVSLYFSSGGGMLGLGPHEGPRIVARAWLAMTPQFLQNLEPTSSTPLPAKGRTRLYVLTNRGTFTAEAFEQDLGHNRHALSPLFQKGHELIYNIRVVVEKQRAQQGAPADRPRPPGSAGG